MNVTHALARAKTVLHKLILNLTSSEINENSESIN